jgi:8-oxo-dGTP pyrophosphatase MutT (NUDIX family)
MTDSTKTLYKGRIIKLNLEQVTLPNGQQCELEIIHHPGGVAILALDGQQRMCLLRQFRHAVGGWLWEIPAGKREPGEAPIKTAHRELIEEAGVQANELVPIGEMVPSPGVLTEVVHLFLATNLKPVEQAHEAHEVIEVHWLEQAKVTAMVRAGEITDAKTVSALYHWSLMNPNS